MTYRYEGNKIFFNEKLIHELPGIVNKTFPYQENLVLLYFVGGQHRGDFSQVDSYQNVLSINSNGTVLWRLRLPEKNLLPAFQPDYSGLRLDNNGNFWAGESTGYDNRFKPESGEILERIFTK